MFIVNVVVGNIILDRAVFHDLREASEYAQQKAGEKVWKVDETCVYYGNVESRIYEPKLHKTTDYKDEHILSFTRPIGNSSYVV